MIPKTAEYALRAAVCLAGTTGAPASADLLAERTKVPRSYLNRVLRDLATAGLVVSKPGPGGGHELARPPDEVTLLDVVNAVWPIQRIECCPLGLPSHTSLCPLHRELDQAYGSMQDAFRRVTLIELVDSAGPIPPLCERSDSPCEPVLSEAGRDREESHLDGQPGVGECRGDCRG
jgi:Rrf2 family protein